MMLVTIKLPKNPAHDPHNKVTGSCPFSRWCSDSTGEHHTGIVRSDAELDSLILTYHITRMEVVDD